MVISFDLDQKKSNSIAKNENSVEEIKQKISSPEFFFNSSSLTPREYSKKIDQYLGFDLISIERELIQQNEDKDKNENKNEAGESWIGLNPQVLQTPYSELYDIFNALKEWPVGRVVDIGCAYARVGIVARAFYPHVHFIGYEIVQERVSEALRISSLYDLDLEILNQNALALDFELPKSSVYFIYDFSNFADIKNMLSKLENKIGKYPFVVVAKGDDIRSIIQLYFPLFMMKSEPLYKRGWSVFFLR